MHKKFEINLTKIKGGFQSGRKVVPHDTKNNLPLAIASPKNVLRKSEVWKFTFV